MTNCMAGRHDNMGIECPECGIHAAYVRAITPDGREAKKNHEIIARELSCGHVVGHKDYMEFRKQIAVIEETEANRIRALREQSKKQRLDVWAQITAIAMEV